MTVWQLVGMFGSIILLDLVLSGDNALVLGAAIAQLPRRQRMYALLSGGAGAILLRIILTSIASMIFNLHWIQTLGALILLVIAYRLLAERNQARRNQRRKKLAAQKYGKQAKLRERQSATEPDEPAPCQKSFRSAMLTIFVADVTMSLDNVLAVGAAANGAFLPMALGLLLSIILILCGSALIAELMGRFTWLLDAAALVLAWTSGNMIYDDLSTAPFFKLYLHSWPPELLPLACCVGIGCVLLSFYIGLVRFR